MSNEDSITQTENPPAEPKPRRPRRSRHKADVVPLRVVEKTTPASVKATMIKLIDLAYSDQLENIAFIGMMANGGYAHGFSGINDADYELMIGILERLKHRLLTKIEQIEDKAL